MLPADQPTDRDYFESLLLLTPHERLRELERIGEFDRALAERLSGLLESDEQAAELAPLISLKAPARPDAPMRLLADGEVVSTTVGRVRVDRILAEVRPRPAAQVYRVRGDGPSDLFVLKGWETETLDPALVRRLRIESRALTLLRHPGVVSALAAGPVAARNARDRRLIAVMTRYAEGRHLDEWASGRPAHDIGATIASLARTIAFVHGRGVLHRDLKPSNVIVTPRGRPVVLDLGMARLLPASRAARSVESSCLTVGGTLHYMAPEQLTPALAPVDERADVYALGVMLWELLTREPYLDLEGLTEAETFLRKSSKLPAAPGGDTYRDRLLRIARIAADGDPQRRYASAALLAAAIDAAAQPLVQQAVLRPRGRVTSYRIYVCAALAGLAAACAVPWISGRAPVAAAPGAAGAAVYERPPQPDQFEVFAQLAFTFEASTESRSTLARETLQTLQRAADLTAAPGEREAIANACVLLGEGLLYGGLAIELAADAFDEAAGIFASIPTLSAIAAADARFAQEMGRRLRSLPAPALAPDRAGFNDVIAAGDLSAASLRRRSVLLTEAARQSETRGELGEAARLAALAVADCGRAARAAGAGPLDSAQLAEAMYLMASIQVRVAPESSTSDIESAAIAAAGIDSHRPDLARLWRLRVDGLRAVRLASLGDGDGFVKKSLETLAALDALAALAADDSAAPSTGRVDAAIRASLARECITFVQAGHAGARDLALQLLQRQVSGLETVSSAVDAEQDLARFLVFVELEEALRGQ